MLATRVKLYMNPWDHTFPSEVLSATLLHIASKRAEHVEKQYGLRSYSRDSLGLALLNPAAALQLPSSETLLATIAIGPEGERYIPNAIAKAVYHRDHGQPAGYGVYIDLSKSADGDFAYGHSTCVDGTFAGASGQSELQDRMEAGHAAVTFNYYVHMHRKSWLDGREERPRWFCDMDEPGDLYAKMAALPALLYDSAS